LTNQDEAVMKTKTAPLLVAIVGGSGAGKSWLADELQKVLGRQAARISLDDFYRDRSHLPPGRRARINFDHPRAIDWGQLEKVLGDCLAGRTTQLPQYDFNNHTRRTATQILRPVPIILMDGLWLLRRPKLRQVFGLSIFIDCPAKTRLGRRVERDLKSRGRSHASVHHQFWKTVEPMHRQYVTPQARRAEIHLKAPISKLEVRQIAGLLSAKLNKRVSGHLTTGVI
jgi:uridine kinase